MGKYFMISILGIKEESKNKIEQILWHNCYKLTAGEDSKESILGQSVLDFNKENPGARLCMYLMNEIEKDGKR